MTAKLLELAEMCCGTCTCSASLKAEVKRIVDENELLRNDIELMRRRIVATSRVDRFGRVEQIDVDWSKRPDIIGPNGNDGEHYND